MHVHTISAVNISITVKNPLLLLLHTVKSVSRISYNNNNKNRTTHKVLIARANKTTKRRHRHVASPCYSTKNNTSAATKKLSIIWRMFVHHSEIKTAGSCHSSVSLPALLSSLTSVAVFMCFTLSNCLIFWIFINCQEESIQIPAEKVIQALPLLSDEEVQVAT